MIASCRWPAAWRGSASARASTCCSWLPTGADSILLMLALNHLGAVYVPVNLAYRGRLLEHVVRVSDARLMVAHADLVPRLEEIEPARLEAVVVLGGTAATRARGARPRGAGSERSHAAAARAPDRAVGHPDRDLHLRHHRPVQGRAVVLLPGLVDDGAGGVAFITGADRYFMTMPMFHVGGTGLVNCMTFRAGSLAVVPSFDTEQLLAPGATHRGDGRLPARRHGELPVEAPAGAGGSRPPAEARLHGAAGRATLPRFAARFGVDVRTVFNMTEINNPIVSEPQPQGRGFCGRPRPGSEARLVDANDCEVPPGEVGEMILRTRPAVGAQPRLPQRPGGRPRAPGATAGSTPATPSARTPRATTTSSTG